MSAGRMEAKVIAILIIFAVGILIALARSKPRVKRVKGKKLRNLNENRNVPQEREPKRFDDLGM